MHTPVRDPIEEDEEPDVKQPPVPPDQEPDVVPQRDPPKPGENTPLIARGDGSSTGCQRRWFLRS